MRAALDAAGEAPQGADDAPAPPPLRFITCGSVDDGKSTLIGRLLLASGSVPDDALEALARDSARHGTIGAAPDPALLLDGLAAEREQGITIDVAYRAFATPRRAFVVADTPGHEQYTRNMATGASTADLAVLLVDAPKALAAGGLLPQTRRHAFITAMLGVRHVVVAVNKMDLLGFAEEPFRRLEAQARAALAPLDFAEVAVIPLSARDGENVAARSPATPWYDGPALLEHLERAGAGAEPPAAFRMAVQWVNRPSADFRGLTGTISAGAARPGDAVALLPSGGGATIARVLGPDGERAAAVAGEAVTLVLREDVDAARGEALAGAAPAGAPDDGLRARRGFPARLLWTSPAPLDPARAYELRLGTATALATARVGGRIDLADFAPRPATGLAVNELGEAAVLLDRPLAAAPYARSRAFGGFVLIDRATNETVALGLVREEGAGQAPAGGLAGRLARPLRLARPFAPAPGAAPAGADAGLLRAASWRLGAAGLLGLGVLALTRDPALALVVGAADAALRPPLRRLHAAAWTALAPRGGAGRDGDGI